MKPRSKKRPVKSRVPAKTKSRRKRTASPQARYEAAFSGFFDRSWLPASVQDARYDADSSTRLELVRRSRYWERNNAIVNRLADVFEQYTVGPSGLQVIPTCEGDDGEDWNHLASRWWADWSKWPAVDNGLPMGVQQSLMARTWFVDGELFIYKTFSPDTGRPRIQLIEGHRIGTPPELRHEEGRSIIDGVEFRLDKNSHPVGKPLRYWVRTDDVAFYAGGTAPLPQRSTSGTGSWDWIEGERMLHLFEPARPGMYRGLPFLYPVMNDLHDLDDLQFLEMKAAKSNSDVANVVTNKTGEASVAASRRQRWQIQSQDQAGNPVNKQSPLFYETTVGGRTIYISNGEKFEQFKSDRPSVATKEYWDYLVRKICAGVGISALLVLPFSLQGTVTRADMDVSNAFFRSRSGVLAAVLREIYLWAMSWAVKYDRALDGAPDEWWHCAIRPPRSIVVDLGRNSWAITEELDKGIRTAQDVCAEMGHDWRHVYRQRAIEASYVDDLVKEFGIAKEDIVKPAQPNSKGAGNPTTIETTKPAEPDPTHPTTPTAPAPAAAPIAITLDQPRGWNVVRDESGAILRYDPA